MRETGLQMLLEAAATPLGRCFNSVVVTLQVMFRAQVAGEVCIVERVKKCYSS